MGTRKDIRTVTIEAPVTLDDLRWMVDHCDGLDGTSEVQISVGFAMNGRPDPDVTPSIVVHGRPMGGGFKPPKVYRERTTRTGPGSLPTIDDLVERRT